MVTWCIPVYTTQESRSEEVCSAYVLLTSDDRGFEGHMYTEYTK